MRKIWKDSYYNLLLSVGNWWEGSAAPEEWSDDEVYGAEAGASIKTMLLQEVKYNCKKCMLD